MCVQAQSCPTLCDPMDCSAPGFPVHGISQGKNTGVGSLFLLQGIFPTQESNQGLLHCGRILYQLSYQGSHSSFLLAIYFTHDSVYMSFLLSQLLTLPFILPPLCSYVHSLYPCLYSCSANQTTLSD